MSRRVCRESQFQSFSFAIFVTISRQKKRLLSQPTVKLQIVVSLRRPAEGTDNDPLW